jgi:hypothetical protein
MKIERVRRYAIDGKEFPTLAKAKDYADGQVNKMLQNIFTRGDGTMQFSVTECVRITEALLLHREEFAEWLTVKGPDDSDEEEY